MIKKRYNGFTLVEIIVVLAMMAILVFSTGYFFGTFTNIARLSADTEMIRALLARTRSKSIYSESGNAFGVYFATTTVYMFQGSYSTSSSALETYPLSTGVSVSTTLNDDGQSILFDHLSGSAGSYGTITLNRLGVATSTLLINEIGIVYGG